MEYSKIIAVTGMPGLFELLSSKSDGAIVRSLDDKNTRFISSRIHNFSHLESIEVFTVRENVNLAEIFHAMEQNNPHAPDAKDNAALKKYFERVYPDIDFERVYTSDLKKMVKWFEVLKANDIEIKLSQPAIEESSDEKADEPIADVPGKEKEKVAVEEPKQVREVREARPENEIKEKKKEKEKTEDKEEKKAPAKKKAAPKKATGKKEEKTTTESKPKKSAPKKKK